MYPWQQKKIIYLGVSRQDHLGPNYKEIWRKKYQLKQSNSQ